MPNGEDNKTVLLLVGAGALALFAFWYMSNQGKGDGNVPTTSTFSNMVVTFS